MFSPRKPRAPVEKDDPFDFPDLPDSFSDQNRSSRNPSSSTSASTSAALPPPSSTPPQLQLRKGLQATVLGSGPNGIGVITKLNTKVKANITHGFIKLKNKAVAKTWEDELDFEGDWGGTLKLKGKGPAKKVEMEDGGEMDGFDDDDVDWEGTLKSKSKIPGMGTIKPGDVKLDKGKSVLGIGLPPRKLLPDADLDDLGFDLDEEIQVDKGKAKTPKKPTTTKFFTRPLPKNLPGPDALDDLDVFDDFNEDEATIKASAAMKALLPPPRIRPPPPPPPTMLANADKEENVDMDDDFALPLNLTNLTLATRPEATGRGPRTSIASTNTDWNSPTTSTSNDRFDSPPSKRFSETSATSLSDGLNSSKPLPTTPSSQVEDEDMEDGLVLPSKSFFKSTSKRELNRLLDRRRRPEYSPTRQRLDMGDMSMQEGLEDGLVFDDPKSELTRKRLVKSKEARSQIPIPTRRSPNGKFFGMPPPMSIGRDSPGKYTRERTQSSVGMGHRSHSTGNSALHGSPSYLASHAHASGSGSGSGSGTSGLPPPSGSGFKAFFSPTRPKSPLQSPGPNIKERSRSGQAYVPMRVPQTPERGLRHQKSSSHLTSPTQHSSSIVRKQSLSSLKDQAGGGGIPQPAFSSISSLHSLAEEPIKPGYATSSGSRLRDPTHASSSKVKQRLPLHGVFPPSSSSASSSSRISGLPVPGNAGSSSSTRSRLLHAQMKRRPYGDGTELEAIEDLEVGDEDRDTDRGSWGSVRSRASNRPSVRAVFSPDKTEKEKEKEKTRSGFSTHSNSTTTSKGKGSEISLRSGKEGSWGRKRGKRLPLLIKHLGGVDKRKVVGEMTWDPHALRWDGNESALRDFDNVPTTTSVRPALITHTDLAKPASPTNPNSYHTSAGTVKVVGNMQFDPITMRWVALNPDDEIDPFGDIDMDFELADDEGGGAMSESEMSSNRAVSSVFPTPTTGTDEEEVRITEELIMECERAEERHRREMRGFVGSGGSWSRSEERREERRLWEIRNLALA